MVSLSSAVLVLGLSFLFYGMVKSFLYYRKTKQVMHLVLLSVIIVIASELWIRAYGGRLKLFFDEYRLLFAILPLAAFLVYNHLREGRTAERLAKDRVRGYFEKYVSPHVISKLLESKNLKLGGKRQEVTVLFTDLRGFTSLTENNEPELVVSLLNRYYEAASKTVFHNDGTIDKFVGDAVMAVFNAPLEQADHVEKAVKCAVEMRLEFKKLNKELKKEGLPELGIGIGIATGVAVTGNVGSQKVVNYTVIGDVVNTAARLQGLAKKEEIVVTESVFKKAGKLLKNASMMKVMVKGKAKELVVYVDK